MSEPSTLERLPPRVLPLLYFGFGQLCLAAAFLLLLWQPGVLAGFFYQTATLAVVHLVTLGWITGSILGAVYLIGPIALRMHVRANRLDYAAFAFFAAGTTGIAGHFWDRFLQRDAMVVRDAAGGDCLGGRPDRPGVNPPLSRVFVAKSRRRRQSKARARRVPEAYLTVRRGARRSGTQQWRMDPAL